MQENSKGFINVFVKEIKEIIASPYRLGLVTWIPLLGLFLLISIFANGVVRDLPIAVVDRDNSLLSRTITAQLDASSTLKVQNSSLVDAKKHLRQGKVYALVIISNNFEKEVRLGHQPALEAMINTQYILIGKIVSAALSGTVMQSAGRIDFVKNLVKDKRASSAMAAVAPIGLHLMPLFNEYKNYFPFLVGAMLPALWQVFIVIVSIISMGVMFKSGEEHRWLEAADGSLATMLLGKMTPYTLIFLLHGLFFFSFVYIILPWSFEGSYLFMILVQFITVIAYQSVALLLFVVGFDYARGLSLGAVYTAPAFAFMGVTFPTSNMPLFGQIWHDLLPISHYQYIQIAQANYGASIVDMMPTLGAIALFLLPLPLVYYRFKKALELSS